MKENDHCEAVDRECSQRLGDVSGRDITIIQAVGSTVIVGKSHLTDTPSEAQFQEIVRPTDFAETPKHTTIWGLRGVGWPYTNLLVRWGLSRFSGAVLLTGKSVNAGRLHEALRTTEATLQECLGEAAADTCVEPPTLRG